MKIFVETYQGLKIFLEEDHFVVRNGSDWIEAETLEEMKTEISEYFQETQFGEANGFFN